MKKIVLSLLITVLGCKAYAQDGSFYIEPKINVASAAVAILNPAVEVGFGKRSALNLDYIGAYSRSDYMGTGYPLLASVIHLEYRVYILNEGHKGLFAGIGAGSTQYKMNKNLIPFLPDEKPKDYYDWGAGYALGMTLGYKFLIKDKFGIELSVSGGFLHSQHELYNGDGQVVATMNATAEWTFYKAGAYFSYRFGAK